MHMNISRKFQKHFGTQVLKHKLKQEVKKSLNLKLADHFSSSSTKIKKSVLNITSYAIKDGQTRQHTQSLVQNLALIFM